MVHWIVEKQWRHASNGRIAQFGDTASFIQGLIEGFI